MRDLNYLHGAWAQEHISNSIHADQTDQLVTRANRAIDAANSRAAQLHAENEQLRADLQRSQRREKRGVDNLVATTLIKDAGRDCLADHMEIESIGAHHFVLSWIEHYGGESSHEFVQGVKEGMKMNMPFSTSEAMRKKFIQGFEAQAKKLYEESGENALTREAFDSIGQAIAIQLVTELSAQVRVEQKARNGARYSEPHPKLFGPEEMRERYGEGNFKAQDFITKD